MSDTPKKKTPAKSTPAKKQAPKKAASPKGTGKPGRPKKVVDKVEAVAKDVEEFLDVLEEIASDDKPKAGKNVVIHANSVKKRSLRERMLKWFK